MNFRSCSYFLTVCEMGNISAAARKLYISQQSLSQHIRKLEEELGAPLFHRDNPLTLTQAGRCFQRAARSILDTLRQLDEELAQCKGAAPKELTIGMLDYGTPDFMPPLIDLFLRQEPDVLLRTRELAPGEAMPEEIPLYISAREVGGNYKSEILFYDQLGISVADSLLKKLYGAQWRERQARLRAGDLPALEGCPFLRHRNTPLQTLSEVAFEQNRFQPVYLPMMGSIQTLTRLCMSGQGAMVTFLGQAGQEPAMPPCYPMPNMPEALPAGFLCYRGNADLSEAARRFLKITRRYFDRRKKGGRNGPTAQEKEN